MVKVFLLRIIDMILIRLPNRNESQKLFLEKTLSNQIKNIKSSKLGCFEFSVFSQFGADGIIHWLINNILNKTFIGKTFSLQDNDFSSALNIKSSRKYPAWIFSWSFKLLHHFRPAKTKAPTNPDIILRFYHQGVLSSHITREFIWPSRAHDEIYLVCNPEKSGYLSVQEQINKKETKYLVIDGNHSDLITAHTTEIESPPIQTHKNILCNTEYSKTWLGVILKNLLLIMPQLLLSDISRKKTTKIKI